MVYDDCTQYLLDKGFLPRSPYVSTQKPVEHVKETNYLAAFSLRNDLPMKFSVFMKDIFESAHEGAKIMIDKGWMESRLKLSNIKFAA